MIIKAWVQGQRPVVACAKNDRRRLISMAGLL